MKKLSLLIALLAPAVASAQTPSTGPMPPLPVGVYGCFGQYGPALPMMFGLLNATTYSNFDGKTGRYSYDNASGVLTLTTGPLAGIKYRRTGAPTANPAVRMMDQKGQLTAYMCPLEAGKDPKKHPW